VTEIDEARRHGIPFRKRFGQGEVLGSQVQGEASGAVTTKQGRRHPLGEHCVAAGDTSLLESFDQPRQFDARLHAQGQALGHQQVDAHGQRIVHDLGHRTCAEGADRHNGRAKGSSTGRAVPGPAARRRRRD